MVRKYFVIPLLLTLLILHIGLISSLGDAEYVYVGGDNKTVKKYFANNFSLVATSPTYTETSVKNIIIDGEFMYVGTTNKLIKSFKSNLTTITEITTSNLGGVAFDEDYIYYGITSKLYKIFKSNLTLVIGPITLDMGGIQAIGLDDEFVYCGGHSNKPIVKLFKSNLTIINTGSDTNGETVGIEVDEDYIYYADATKKTVKKALKSDLTVVAESSTYSSYIRAIKSDNDYVYYGGQGGGSQKVIRKDFKTNLTTIGYSPDYGGEITALALDDTYVYYGGATNKTVKKAFKSNLTLVNNSPDYGATIRVIELESFFIPEPFCKTNWEDDEVYVLTGDMYVEGDCFIIDADGVTLDLNGHTITGDRTGNGILVEEHTNFKIINGEIKDFDTGIYIADSEVVEIENIFLDNNYNGFYIEKSGEISLNNISMNYNYYLMLGIPSLTIDNCGDVFLTNILLNGVGFHAIDSVNLVVENITASNSSYSHGLYFQQCYSVVVKNSFTFGLEGDGISFQYDNGDILLENIISNNNAWGVFVGFDGDISNITLINITTKGNRHEGIYVNGGDISIQNVLSKDNNDAGVYINYQDYGTNDNIIVSNVLSSNNSIGMYITGINDEDFLVNIDLMNITLNSNEDGLYLEYTQGSLENIVTNDNLHGLNIYNSYLDIFNTTSKNNSNSLILESDSGAIKILEDLIDLYSDYADLDVDYNYAFLNENYNFEAEIKFFGMPGDFENPAIFRNLEICNDCIALTDLNSEVVIFQVPGVGEYPETGEYYIDEAPSLCKRNWEDDEVFVLEEDLEVPGNCFLIQEVNNVTIDLNGYTLSWSGDDKDWGDDFDGWCSSIIISGSSNVKIINGTIEGFLCGMYAQDSDNLIFENLTFLDDEEILSAGSIDTILIKNITSVNNIWGIYIEFSTDVSIINSLISSSKVGSDGRGVYVYHPITGTMSNVTLKDGDYSMLIEGGGDGDGSSISFLEDLIEISTEFGTTYTYNNYAFIDDDLDFEAEIRWYMYLDDFENPTIFRNGELCEECIIIDSGEDFVLLQVPGSGEYYIDEAPPNPCDIEWEEDGIYILDEDIVTSGDCFVINANNVTLDLNGHTITGDGTGNGILIEYNNFKVYNGIIQEFDVGIYNTGSSNIFENITLERNTGDGFYLRGSSCNLTNITSQYNHNGVYLNNGKHELLNIFAYSNEEYGIYIGVGGGSITSGGSLKHSISNSNNIGAYISVMNYGKPYYLINLSVEDNEEGIRGIFRKMPGTELVIESLTARENSIGFNISSQDSVINNMYGGNENILDLLIRPIYSNKLTVLNNSDIGSYSFEGGDGLISLEDSYGSATFNFSDINGVSGDLDIGVNYVSIDIPISFANITLLNMPGDFVNPKIFKDDEIYESYTLFSNLNDEVVKFQVEDSGRYTVKSIYNYSPCEIFFSETSPITEGTTFRVWTNCQTQFTLKRNNDITLNDSIHNLGPGTYNFSVQRDNEEDYFFNYDSKLFKVNKKESGGESGESEGHRGTSQNAPSESSSSSENLIFSTIDSGVKNYIDLSKLDELGWKDFVSTLKAWVRTHQGIYILIGMLLIGILIYLLNRK